jgi:hypothetical protein
MNQEQQILNYLREGNAVTPLLALEKFGCMRLASRVHRLREQGYKIETRHKRSNDKVYAEYYLSAESALHLHYLAQKSEGE